MQDISIVDLPHACFTSCIEGTFKRPVDVAVSSKILLQGSRRSSGRKGYWRAYLFPCMMTVFATASRLSLLTLASVTNLVQKSHAALLHLHLHNLTECRNPLLHSQATSITQTCRRTERVMKGFAFFSLLSFSAWKQSMGAKGRRERTDTVSSIIGDQIAIMFSNSQCCCEVMT